MRSWWRLLPRLRGVTRYRDCARGIDYISSYRTAHTDDSLSGGWQIQRRGNILHWRKQCLHDLSSNLSDATKGCHNKLHVWYPRLVCGNRDRSKPQRIGLESTVLLCFQTYFIFQTREHSFRNHKWMEFLLSEGQKDPQWINKEHHAWLLFQVVGGDRSGFTNPNVFFTTVYMRG